MKKRPPAAETPPSSDLPVNPHSARARSLSRILDAAFRVPGTRFRFGLDPLLGMIPGIGDVVGGGFSAYLLWLAVRVGAPTSVLLRMFANILIDSVLGAIPLVGDLFDAAWKANLRNLALLEEYLEHPQRTRISSYFFLLLLVLLLAAVVVGTIWLAVTAIQLLVGWVT